MISFSKQQKNLLVYFHVLTEVLITLKKILRLRKIKENVISKIPLDLSVPVFAVQNLHLLVDWTCVEYNKAFITILQMY